MNPFLNGFADELTKTSGALGWMVKHPLASMAAVTIPVAAGGAAIAGWKKGKLGPGGRRYLAASKDNPSPAAFANYNQLFKQPSAKQKAAPTRLFDRLQKRRTSGVA